MSHTSAFQPVVIFFEAGLLTVGSTVMRWAFGAAAAAAAASYWVKEEFSPPDTTGPWNCLVSLFFVVHDQQVHGRLGCESEHDVFVGKEQR